jgi:hypothetical protein
MFQPLKLTGGVPRILWSIRATTLSLFPLNRQPTLLAPKYPVYCRPRRSKCKTLEDLNLKCYPALETEKLYSNNSAISTERTRTRNERIFIQRRGQTSRMYVCLFRSVKELSLNRIGKTRYNISLFKEVCKRGDFYWWLNFRSFPTANSF